MFAELQDAFNIRRDRNLLFQSADTDEFRSLRYLMDREKELSVQDRTLLFLKNPGEESVIYAHLPINHFIAVIQTPFQRDMLKLHGCKGLCIDSTHHCAAENAVKLTTILVLDETERGVPVGHAFLSNEDIVSCEVFFDVLKEQLSLLNIEWLLSDDAAAFHGKS
jgi:hypothetical protein